MSNLEQYYEVLGISSSAPIDEIKQAYRDLAQVWHPDRYTHNRRLQEKAEAELKTINLAYEEIIQSRTERTTFNDSFNSSQTEAQTTVSSEETEETSSNQISFIENFVKDLFKLAPFKQRELEVGIKKFSSVSSWRTERLTAVGTIGGLTGVIGGPIGMIAIPFELSLCEKSATLGAFGIGYLLECQVDYELDREMILAIWSGEGSLEKHVPAGKVGIKINDKVASPTKAMMGVILTKALVKGSSKFLAKLSAKLVAKAVAKISVKLAAKTSTAWVPIFGGAVSGGVNVWLVKGFLDAAEQYYSAQKMDVAVYLVLNDNQIASEL